MQTPWDGIPARQLIEGIRHGDWRVGEVVSGSLKRIERYNPAVNAVVAWDAVRALQAAQAADAVTDRDTWPPLFGLPVTVKDVFATRDFKTTAGFWPLRAYQPAEDATVVARLRAAGAMILGKTNTSELAADVQCSNRLFGTTRNPWQPDLTSGGSSGGSAAAVALGFSTLDVGSDIAGSIRIPAAFCGVAGLKATEHRIARSGHIPHLPDAERSVWHMLSFGVLGRYVDDLRLGFATVAGADDCDSTVPPLPVATPEPLSRPLRVAWWDDFDGVPLCRRTRAGLHRTVTTLQAAGMTVARCRPDGFDFQAAWSAYGAIAGMEIGLGLPASQRWALACAGGLLPRKQFLLRAFSRGMRFDWRRYQHALNVREQLTAALSVFLQQWDVWLCPVCPTVAFPQAPRRAWAPPHIMIDGQRYPYLEATVSLTVPFSLTGHPVVSLPTGLVDGLPVGVQIVGPRWQDEALVMMSEHIERQLAGWTPVGEAQLRRLAQWQQMP